MTDLQLYLSIGVPVLFNAAMLGIISNLLINHINSRFTAQDQNLSNMFTAQDKLFTEKLKRVEDIIDARLKHLEEK